MNGSTQDLFVGLVDANDGSAVAVGEATAWDRPFREAVATATGLSPVRYFIPGEPPRANVIDRAGLLKE